MATAQSILVIEELPSQGTGQRLELIGGGLPHQGTGWSGNQRLPTKWYVGATEASQQVLGPTELPSEWEGEWHRTMLGRSPATFVDESGQAQQVVRPHELAAAMDSFRLRGFKLRVTWSQGLSEGSGREMRMLREGRLEELTTKVTRAEDIFWTAKFTWMSRGAPSRNPLVRDSQDGLLQSLAAMTRATDAVLAARAAIYSKTLLPGSADGFSLDRIGKFNDDLVKQLDNFGRSVQRNALRLTNLIANVRKVAITPLTLADHALAIAQNTIGLCTSTIALISRTPPEVMSIDTRAKDVANAVRSMGAVSDAARDLRSAALKFASQARTISGVRGTRDDRGAQVDIPLGQGKQRIYRARGGDTPQRVSIIMYGTPDYGVSILRANHLSWYTVEFTPGQVLVIPSDPKSIMKDT